MPFIYIVEGLAPYFTDFSERLTSELALRGTQITGLSRSENKVDMSTEHTGEKGHLSIFIEGNNIKVVYTVERERKEVKEGVVGAITGGALGGIISGLLNKDAEAVVDTIAGAAAGGALGAYHGYERSIEEQTEFARLLAETIRDTENYIRMKIEEQKRAELERLEELRRELEDAEWELSNIEADLLALKEEAEILASEGKDVSAVKRRLEVVERLCSEAKKAIASKNPKEAKAKAMAARKMLDRARDILWQL